MTEDMDDFSHWPEDFEGFTHFSVENWYVKGGQYGNFRKGLKKNHRCFESSQLWILLRFRICRIRWAWQPDHLGLTQERLVRYARP